MQKSSLCGYNGAYILAKKTKTITRAGPEVAAIRTDKSKLFAQLISEISNTLIDRTKDIDVVMYNLKKYVDNSSKTSRSLWQYDRDKPHDNIKNYQSFKFKAKTIKKLLKTVTLKKSK